MEQIPYVDIGGQYRSQRDELLPLIDALLSSGQYILGEEVAKFEKAFASLCGTRYAVAVANGTDSLILSYRALGIQPGDEVITAPNSWISSASSIALIGARPVFVDVLKDQTMDPEKLEKAITSKTKAILPVHLTGKCADMNPILEVAKKKNIAVIEDAAQSVGARYFGKAAGSMGAIGSFSLHPLKNLNACGDAGILTTNNEALYRKLASLRHHGLEDRNTVNEWGYNSRLDALQAAILNYRFKHLPKIIERRRYNANFYRHELKDLVYCPEDREGCFDVYHLFVIQAERRDALKEFLAKDGIHSAIHYPIPIHLQPCARQLGYHKGSFPEVERQSEQILSLPVHQEMTDPQLERVTKRIRSFYR